MSFFFNFFLFLRLKNELTKLPINKFLLPLFYFYFNEIYTIQFLAFATFMVLEQNTILGVCLIYRVWYGGMGCHYKKWTMIPPRTEWMLYISFKSWWSKSRFGSHDPTILRFHLLKTIWIFQEFLWSFKIGKIVRFWWSQMILVSCNLL